MSMRRIILWLRRDLRLHDNAIFDRARWGCLTDTEPVELVPVYVFDPREYKAASVSTWSSEKTGRYRARFIAETVTDMKQTLSTEFGSDLLVFCGQPEDILHRLVAGPQDVVVVQQECTHEEIMVENAVESSLRVKNVPLNKFSEQTL